MPQYRDISILLDRRRHDASYFVEDGRLSLGSLYGSKTVVLGRRKPGVVAQELLLEIVEAWQVNEKARLASASLIPSPNT